MAASHQETYVINASMQALCDVIRSQGFANQLKVGISAERPWQSGVCFQLYHGVSFTSWGETIMIALTPMGQNVTQVNIRSECDMPTQIIDWGKNKQVVRSIHQHLETYVNRGPAMQNNMQTPPPQAQPVQTAAAFCSRCGTRVAAGANFCMVCGTKLN